MKVIDLSRKGSNWIIMAAAIFMMSGFRFYIPVIDIPLQDLSPSIKSPKTGPLKVYILAGQSNMQGSAHKRTFELIADDPETAHLMKKIVDNDGEPVVCENAYITYSTHLQGSDTILSGKVKVGYGFDHNRIGPEYAFGLFMDDAHEEPILLIKTAWGGKSLAVDFRPPSAGPYEPSKAEMDRGNIPGEEEVGYYYRKMIQHIKETLKTPESIRKIIPGYDEQQGYELAGFVWFQGWNDLVNRHHLDQYTENMIQFITDVREELNVSRLPLIIGILGVYGTNPDNRRFDKQLPVTDFRQAQFAAVAQYDSKAPAMFRGNVKAVDSGPFYELELSDIYWKRRLTNKWKEDLAKGKMTESEVQEQQQRYGINGLELTPLEQSVWDREASNAEYHYLGSSKTFVQFGKALAEAMLELERK